MIYSIVTAVRNPGRPIRGCRGAVAGQDGTSGEHIVIDGASTDGTVEWLRGVAPEGEIGGPRAEVGGRRAEVGEPRAEDRRPRTDGREDRNPRTANREPRVENRESLAFGPRISDLGSRTSDLDPRSGFRSLRLYWLSEPDRGMYDALNKGFDMAAGEILGWLNADEQYLPGTLASVAEWFAAHPACDILFGDHLVVGEDGHLLARRRVPPVRWPYILASHLYGLSCAMFFRRRVWDAGHRFDPSYRSVGDADWVVRVLRSRFRAGTTDRPLAAFTFGPGNLSRQDVSRQEERRLRAAAPAWVRAGRGPFNLARRIEMAARGACRRTPHIEYELFTGAESPVRTRFEARDVDWRWPV